MADWLTFRGERRVLDSTPLESHLRGLPARPDLRLEGRASRTGYRAHWEVRENFTLWLARLDTRPADQWPDPGLTLLFPNATGPVPADWVSQRLISPTQEKRYSFGGPAPARELHMWVSKGRVLLIEERGPSGGRLSYEFTRHLDAEFGPEEAAFLRAIHAAPGDSAPRLVYADWLEEHNDPRAKLIREVERLRAMSPEAGRRERAAKPELLRGLHRGMWESIMGYGEWIDLAQPHRSPW
jgi:uncharacterized protein (TIGR02996 family)